MYIIITMRRCAGSYDFNALLSTADRRDTRFADILMRFHIESILFIIIF